MAPGGWTWPSGETESAYLNHWIFSWNTQTCRDQHENINRKRPSRGVHFRITFIIAICRCLESFCFCCYLLSLDGTCCCCLWRFNVCYYLRPGPLPFAPCFLLFAAVLHYLLAFAGVSCSLLLLTAMYCCLLLFATICCFLHNFLIFVAYLLLQDAICLVFADLACCYCCWWGWWLVFATFCC